MHLDLVRHGIIPDPFIAMHEPGVAWVDERRWSYETTFEWTPSPDHPIRVLRFEGLDTVCEVFLNGESVARHDNMFVPLEIDVTSRLQRGKNELRIDFESAVKVGQGRRREYFDANGIDWKTQWFDERAFVRKAQYMSGWDWGPRLVSCGIWQPVKLLEFRGRIRRISYLQERLSSGRFRVVAEPEIEGEGRLAVAFGDQTRSGGDPLEFELAPELWWPNGEGAQTLYPAIATMDTGHRVEKQIGFRTARLLRERDDHGRSFEFEVNGRRIYARGANWIPNDSFPSRICPCDISTQIARYKGLGLNMLRVWGGGFYESEAFYDECDLRGILVWQDFPFACSYYPDGAAEKEIVRKEATEQVLRLRDRASLALWCGNNENEALWLGKWGGAELAPPRYFGEEIYSEVLRDVVEELDPAHDYIRTSPTAVEPEEEVPGLTEENWGDAHYWDVWHGRGDWVHYSDSQTRFSSEFGFASSPSLDAWRQIGAGSEVDSEVAWWHNKTGKTPEVFRGYAGLHYPEPQTLENWTYISQLNQRDALRHGIEYFRRNELCRGTLIWQMNDCWPVQSWAVEDYSRLLKPAGHELRRLYAPTMLSLAVGESDAELYVAHEGPEPFDGNATVDAFDTLTGERTPLGAFPVTVCPGGRAKLSIAIARFTRNRTAIRAAIAGQDGSERWAWLCEPKDLQLKPVRLTARASEELSVEVGGFVADLVVWDDDDLFAVRNRIDCEEGWEAMTAANTAVIYNLASRPVRLRARSLAGEHEISMD
ncbi:glycoside hydrolase family 2 immunoglobulin domain-containing protein beta-sandwich [Fimbriimonas ginsengisoli Gsoil 348]|uniref:beta-mannosidase n=1 Tax=Fimbriimonas ginsengisoli Gsoil 348 TaxID=661478 RepID=A0A068NTT0_FIMGI|nr:glycoside hydrolase family 2 immunoglobulin domain-containing protein beta-sandwich [Fimbriimonas ginsengisoli Gsoil 348]